MPWKNGQGRTFEIAKREWEPGSGPVILWRLSIAEIAADSDFSIFPHLNRFLAVIDGAGIELDFAERSAPTRLELHQAIRFRGDAPIACRLLGGPTRDLNLMVDRRAASFEAELVTDGKIPVLDDSDLHLLVCVTGRITVDAAELEAGDTAIIQVPAKPPVTVSKGAVYFRGAVRLLGL